MHSASTSTRSNLFRSLLASCLLALPLCFWPLACCSQAATAIVDTNGFESGFTVGQTLQGQGGWVTSGQGGSTAKIQNGTVESGSKAVRVDRGPGSDDRWAMPVGGLGFPNNRYILVDWDMNVTGTSAMSGFGPFFGVDTYDDTVSPKVLGSLGVDATTGDVLYQAGGSGVLVETGASVGFGQWHHFRIQLDFFLDEYQVFLDGSPLLLDTNLDPDPESFVDGPSDTFTDADIATFAAAFDAGSQNQTGTAYFDNFLVRDIARADFDIDGDVEDDDLTLWKGAFGLTDGADADVDGDSDGHDFLIWQRDIDLSVSPLTSPVSNVPEPSSLALALLPLCMGWRRLRCRQ